MDDSPREVPMMFQNALSCLTRSATIEVEVASALQTGAQPDLCTVPHTLLCPAAHPDSPCNPHSVSLHTSRSDSPCIPHSASLHTSRSDSPYIPHIGLPHRCALNCTVPHTLLCPAHNTLLCAAFPITDEGQHWHHVGAAEQHMPEGAAGGGVEPGEWEGEGLEEGMCQEGQNGGQWDEQPHLESQGLSQDQQREEGQLQWGHGACQQQRKKQKQWGPELDRQQQWGQESEQQQQWGPGYDQQHQGGLDSEQQQLWSQGKEPSLQQRQEYAGPAWPLPPQPPPLLPARNYDARSSGGTPRSWGKEAKKGGGTFRVGGANPPSALPLLPPPHHGPRVTGTGGEGGGRGPLLTVAPFAGPPSRAPQATPPDIPSSSRCLLSPSPAPSSHGPPLLPGRQDLGGGVGGGLAPLGSAGGGTPARPLMASHTPYRSGGRNSGQQIGSGHTPLPRGHISV